MKVFIVGGTGFIGYHAALEFLKHGHRVATISLPDIELGDWFPKEVDVTYGNIFEMDENELTELFKGFDAMLYAVGPDDRVVPTGSAYDFFHERLVVSCSKAARCARKAGIQKAIVLGSYFCYFHRIWPEKGIAQNNPYVLCRVEQAEAVIQEGRDEMAVCVLELPFIFGSMPERPPLWKEVIVDPYFNRGPFIFCAKGGNNMVSVRTVAKAILGAVEHGQHGKRYPIGDVNMTHNEMFEIMMEGYSIKKRIVNVPRFALAIAGRILKRNQEKEGQEGGLNLAHYMKHLLTDYLYYDAQELSQRELGYEGGDVREAILEAMAACKRADATHLTQ